MRGGSKLTGALAVLCAAAALIPIAAVSAKVHRGREHGRRTVGHVLLISVDGLHQSDLQWYVSNHPESALAKLVRDGVEYPEARTPIPSDSFPGLVAQVTGGNPRTTGIYYDASYNHDLLPPGTTSCPAGAPRGTAVNYDESLDLDSSRIDAGQGLANLPGSILGLTGSPQTLISPKGLPVDPKTCRPVYPHQYLKVNTIFNVARANGLRTAWSDKHPAYEILNGPSGNGVQDLFTPEINSNAIGYAGGIDWTGDNLATQQYDSYKVQSVINEIDGYDHSASNRVGVPAIFGMNFQTVSTAQKLPASQGWPGGYLPGTDTPGPVLQGALDYVNAKLGLVVQELRHRGLLSQFAIIISAKHGQSPIDPNSLTRIDDGTITDGINADWKAQNPGAGDLVVGGTNDDALQLYLSDRSPRAQQFVRHWLLSHPATGNTLSGGSRTLDSSGLARVFVGRAAARYFGVPESDPRHPDVWGVVQHGVVYTGKKGKIAEHGGAAADDRHVPILVVAPGVTRAPGQVSRDVETTQIAPTILKLLGLDPFALRAVQEEGTRALPGL